MKIIEGTQNLTKNQPRFVEVGNKILMNGAVYNFNDFTPVPYNWCEVDCQAYQGNNIAFNKDYMISFATRSENTSWRNYGDPYYFNTGAYDSKDGTTYYKTTESNSADTNKNSTLFSKLKIVDEKVYQVKALNIPLNNIQIIGQSDDYVFVVGNKAENTTLNYAEPPMSTYYGVVKKDTLVYSEILTGLSSHINCNAMGPTKLLKETSDYIILIQSTNAYTNTTNGARNNGDIQVIRINKTTRAVDRFNKTEILVEADSDYGVAVVNEYDNFLMRDAHRYVIYNAMYNKKETKVELFYNLVNINDGFIGTELLYEHRDKIEIDWDNASNEVITKFTSGRVAGSQEYAHGVRYKFIYNKCADKTYLTVVHYKTTEFNGNDKYTGTCAFTFTMNAYGNLKFETYTDLPKFINAFMPMDDEGKRFYAIDNSNLYYIEFNETTKKLGVVSTNNLAPTSVGLDSAGRTWVIATNGDVHMFNENVSAKIAVAFKDAAYDYTGLELDTGLILSCTNVFGTKISADIELEIRGNAYFKLTGSKKVRVTTLPLTDTEVALVINGPGQLSIIPKVIL